MGVVLKMRLVSYLNEAHRHELGEHSASVPEATRSKGIQGNKRRAKSEPSQEEGIKRGSWSYQERI